MTTAAQPRTQHRKPRGRIKRIGDGTLLVAAILISAMALTVCWFGVRTAETGIMRYEAKMSARSWTVFLLDNLPNVAGIMAGQGVTEEDRSVIGSAIGAGGILGFQIMGGDGRVVYASRQGDIGTTTADPHFRSTVQKGHIHAAIRGIGTFGLEPQVVSEAFVPIIGGGRFLGAIQVQEDVTARADQLSRIGYLSFLGLLGFILLIALVMTALVAKNFEGSLRAKRALATSRKRLENYQGQLVRAKESAEAAGELRSGVLADVIDEMRTPIGGVMEVATLLTESELTDRQRRWVGTITQSAETMLNAVDNVLDFRRIEADAIEIDRVEFDLPDTIAEVVDALAGAAAGKKLELAYYVAGDAPERVWGDPKRLHQVLFTLVDSAVQRTDRGEIVLHASADRDGSGDPIVRFEVRDTGAGMSPEDQALLRDAAAQPATPDGGAELGLSICRRLIHEMGGELEVESDPDQGTCFRFSLRFDPAGHGVARSPGDIERLAGKRILIVDDSAMIREILLRHFADWSVDADAAADGESAIGHLAHAAEQGRPYDVVVVDMTMPGMSGLELATAIREEPTFGNVRLVMLTAVDAPTEDIEASGTGISARVEKPVHARTLLDEITSVIVDAPALRHAEAADDGSASATQDQSDDEAGYMAEKYLRHTLISLEKLREAVASDKPGAVQMTADSLKSSSTEIGATALAGLCRELESMARVGNLGGVQSMLDAIEEEYGKVCETLRAELSADLSDAADPRTPAP